MGMQVLLSRLDLEALEALVAAQQEKLLIRSSENEHLQLANALTWIARR